MVQPCLITGIYEILKLAIALTSCSCAHELVIKKVNDIASSYNNAHQTKTEPISDILARERQILFGHVTHREPEHSQG